MLQTARELWLALLAILITTALYLFVVLIRGGIPAAGEFFGHSLGIFGFALMLMTEFLYSRRKRSKRARWGKMSSWLQFHIFTGIVGPYLVFLHTSFKFNGLAGIVLLFTAIIVLSGFIGRYIYTAVPRTADGAEVEFGQLESQITDAENEIAAWVRTHPEAGRALQAEIRKLAGFQGGPVAAIFLRGPFELYAQFTWLQLRRRFSFAPRNQLDQLARSLQRRRALSLQIAVIATARRMLGLWHTIHVPLGVVLFTTAIIHIIAAVYYATLLK